MVQYRHMQADTPSGQQRKYIKPGSEVDIILKKDQPTGALTHGIVQALLTSKAVHPRGIKVRLTSGEVGRVHTIYIDGVKYENEPYESVREKTGRHQKNSQGAVVTSSNAESEDFDNFI